MNPLELAKSRKASKIPACKDCSKSERVDNVLYCSVTGKIILPIHEDMCVCGGERLEDTKKRSEEQMNNDNLYYVTYCYYQTIWASAIYDRLVIDHEIMVIEENISLETIQNIELSLRETTNKNAKVVGIVKLEAQE